MMKKHTRALKKAAPRLYLAGKFRKNCWRHFLVPGLREHSWDLGPLSATGFTYVGPFPVGCDHGCYHRPGGHGGGIGCSPDLDTTFDEIVELCLGAIGKSDLVVAYIDEDECYGSVAEIMFAQAHGIPTVVLLAPGMANEQHNEYRFICSRARWVVYDVTQTQLPDLLRWAICKFAS